MNKNIFIPILLAVGVVSCNTNYEYKNAENFTWNDFQKTEEIQSKVFLSDSLVFKPMDLRVFGNYLVLKDYGGENGCFRVFDLKTKKLVCERITKGSGPLEMLSPQFAKSDKDRIVIWDMQKLLLHEYNVGEFVTDDSPIPTKMTKLDNGIYINIGTTEHGTLRQIYDKDFMLCKYDTITGQSEKFAPFPSFRYEDYHPVIKRDAYYMNFTSDNMSTIAICYSMTDLIELYSMDGYLIRRMHGPDGFFPYFKMSSSESIEGASPIEDKCRDAYFAPRNHGDYFTVMYNGRHLNEENHSSSSDKIFSFSWKGDPLVCYNLDKKIVSYDFDTNNKKIYAIAIDPEYMIIEYDYQ